MAEIYPRKAPGDFAGTKCIEDSCHYFARFTVTPHDEVGPRIGACGQHIGQVIKGLMLTSDKAIVVQEVPGNWGHNERAIINGQMTQVYSGAGNGGR